MTIMLWDYQYIVIDVYNINVNNKTVMTTRQ